MGAPANHTLCASCGAPHNQWPGLDEDGGDLCDACFAEQADEVWFSTGRGAIDHPTGRREAM